MQLRCNPKKCFWRNKEKTWIWVWIVETWILLLWRSWESLKVNACLSHNFLPSFKKTMTRTTLKNLKYGRVHKLVVSIIVLILIGGVGVYQCKDSCRWHAHCSSPKFPWKGYLQIIQWKLTTSLNLKMHIQATILLLSSMWLIPYILWFLPVPKRYVDKAIDRTDISSFVVTK